MVNIICADLSIARHETEALIKNRHPFLVFKSTGGSSRVLGSQRNGFCHVCSEQNMAKVCKECDMQFCMQCDQQWHGGSEKQSHQRTSLHEEKRFGYNCTTLYYFTSV